MSERAQSLRRLLRATPSIMAVSVAQNVAYRAELVIWVLTSILPLIMLALWSTVTADTPIAGMGQVEVTRYFVVTMLCRQLTGSWVVWDLTYQIRTGSLSPHLIRPFPPIYLQAVLMITAIPIRILTLMPILILLVLRWPDLIALPAWPYVLAFIPSILCAWILSFVIQVCFALLSFWIDRSDGLFTVYQSVWSLLSGYLAPLAFFPPAWRALLDWLPFRATLAAPVELMAGLATPHTLWLDLGRQSLWIALFSLLALTLWHHGLKRYAAFGA